MASVEVEQGAEDGGLSIEGRGQTTKAIKAKKEIEAEVGTAVSSKAAGAKRVRSSAKSTAKASAKAEEKPGTKRMPGTGAKPAARASTRAGTGAGADVEAQIAVVRKLLKRVEQKLSGQDVKASLADYFPHNGYPVGHPLRVDFSGMPFYDSWTQAQFSAQYGHSMASILTNDGAPADFPDETAFLLAVVGNFTDAIKSHVLSLYSNCRFEVLFPTDVNQTAFNTAVNYPTSAWTPGVLSVLKTEAFGFTVGRNLDKSEECIDFGAPLGFPAAQRSQLVGIGDVATAWPKEAAIAVGKGFESVVLFALDQFCLIGYDVPLAGGERRSVRQGR